MITGHPGIDVGPHPDEPADDPASPGLTRCAGPVPHSSLERFRSTSSSGVP